MLLLKVEQLVEKLAKRKLEDVIAAIPLIKNLIYILIRIDPRDFFVNLFMGMKD